MSLFSKCLYASPAFLRIPNISVGPLKSPCPIVSRKTRYTPYAITPICSKKVRSGEMNHAGGTVMSDGSASLRPLRSPGRAAPFAPQQPTSSPTICPRSEPTRSTTWQSRRWQAAPTTTLLTTYPARRGQMRRTKYSSSLDQSCMLSYLRSRRGHVAASPMGREGPHLPIRRLGCSYIRTPFTFARGLVPNIPEG